MNDEIWVRRATFLVRLGISVVLLVAALFVVLSGSYDDSFNKWAFGIIGIVVGYWLR